MYGIRHTAHGTRMSWDSGFTGFDVFRDGSNDACAMCARAMPLPGSRVNPLWVRRNRSPLPTRIRLTRQDLCTHAHW